MTTKATIELQNTQTNATKAELDGGFMYFFAGPEPETADEALDMVGLHTEVLKLSLGGDGVTGLVFDAANEGVIAKPVAAVWDGLIAFSGAQSGQTTLTPTFYRFCAAGDNGRAVAAGSRLQGSVGGPQSNRNVRLSSDTLTANGLNRQGLANYTYNLGSAD